MQRWCDTSSCLATWTGCRGSCPQGVVWKARSRQGTGAGLDPTIWVVERSDGLGSGTTALPHWAQVRGFAGAGSMDRAGKLIAALLMRGSQRT
jgi:hypothetical protein